MRDSGQRGVNTAQRLPPTGSTLGWVSAPAAMGITQAQALCQPHRCCFSPPLGPPCSPLFLAPVFPTERMNGKSQWRQRGERGGHKKEGKNDAVMLLMDICSPSIARGKNGPGGGQELWRCGN